MESLVDLTTLEEAFDSLCALLEAPPGSSEETVALTNFERAIATERECQRRAWNYVRMVLNLQILKRGGVCGWERRIGRVRRAARSQAPRRRSRAPTTRARPRPRRQAPLGRKCGERA